MHMSMNHANPDKLIEQSKQVDGIPRTLRKPDMMQGQCHTFARMPNPNTTTILQLLKHGPMVLVAGTWI
eukprot:3149032-Rhodomonas_salina.1